MARDSGAILHRSARWHLDRERAECEAPSGGEALHEPCLERRPGPDSVVDMRDGQAPCTRRRQPCERIEQGRGVRSSTAGDQHVLAGGDDPSPVRSGRDRPPHPRHRGCTLAWRQRAAVAGRGGGSWIRTRDIPGMNRVLYHLS
jgi:hypothetical protein